MDRRIRIRGAAAALLLAAMTASCGGRPSGILSDKKMAEVEADMELTIAVAERSRMLLPDSVRKVLMQYVLERHGVSQEMYDSTMSYYGRNMDEYAQVLDNASKLTERRRLEMMHAAGSADLAFDAGMWLGAPVAMISPLSESGVLSFELPEAQVDSGDMLHWKMHVSNPRRLRMLLGVEYADGSLGYAWREFSGTKRIDGSLQTDSMRQVRRIFGHLKTMNTGEPVFIDSISLSRMPLVSQEYGAIRSQHTFGQKKKTPPPPQSMAEQE